MIEQRYNTEEIRDALDGVMECQLEWEGVPENDGQMLRLMPQLYAVSRKDAQELYESIGQIGRYMAQMGQLIGRMQQRMDEMEARQAAVTISHADAKRLQALMRIRADQLCAKHGLGDPESRKAIRAAIRKDVLKRCNVKDLHDIPEAKLEGTERQIDSWTSIRLIMERKGRA